MKLKIVSWNVNGLRALAKKQSLADVFQSLGADIICLQETKIGERESVTSELAHVPNYESFWSFAQTKKGYSGVVTYCKKRSNEQEEESERHAGVSVIPVDAWEGIGVPKYDTEGRVVVTDHKKFLLFNVYFPNGGGGPERHQFKLDFYKEFQRCVEKYVAMEGRHVIFLGDVNTAHREIDLHNPAEALAEERSGFGAQDRAWIDGLLKVNSSHERKESTTIDEENNDNNDATASIDDANNKEDDIGVGVGVGATNGESNTTNGGIRWVDTLRFIHGDKPGMYTWWDPQGYNRANNKGWRLDYCFTDEKFANKYVVNHEIMSHIRGSDHCPIRLTLDFDKTGEVTRDAKKDAATTTTITATKVATGAVSIAFKNVAARHFPHLVKQAKDVKSQKKISSFFTSAAKSNNKNNSSSSSGNNNNNNSKATTTSSSSSSTTTTTTATESVKKRKRDT